MKKQFAIIYWTDAAMHGLDQFTEKEVEKCGLMKGITAGVIAKEDKESITLALDWFYEEKSYRQLSTYPKSGIRKIVRREIPSDKIRKVNGN